jgi:hypothetical protein
LSWNIRGFWSHVIPLTLGVSLIFSLKTGREEQRDVRTGRERSQMGSPASSSSPIWECLAAFVRAQIQRVLPALVEEEITARLGRPTSARRAAVAAPRGCGMALASPGGGV